MLTDKILELIGNTLLLQLKGERSFHKAEVLDPGGSIKYPVALTTPSTSPIPLYPRVFALF